MTSITIGLERIVISESGAELLTAYYDDQGRKQYHSRHMNPDQVARIRIEDYRHEGVVIEDNRRKPPSIPARYRVWESDRIEEA